MSNTHVLVVEDEKIVAMEIQDRLIDLGYKISDIVSSGEEAIEKATKLLPDLVLMDIMLKGQIDGIEAAKQIQQTLDIPVIYLTAFADDDTLHRAKITEPFGYIIKPFVERELYTTIEMALYKHKMGKKLRENEQWLATTLNSISDAVIATNEDGTIKFINPVAEELTGWKQQYAMGKELSEVYHIIDETTRKRFENPLAKILSPEKLYELSSTKILISLDRKERIISDSGAPIRDPNGRTRGLVLVFRDITEQRKLEMDLLKAQKLESIGILAGGIAHDFNNILTAIVGNISLAKANTEQEDDIHEILTEAERASLQAKNLTLQLLTFAKGGAPLKKTASIIELIKASADFALRGSNVRCEFAFPDDLWAVEIDVGQISQVIQNIVVNADQSMPEGGIIQIIAENATVNQEQGLPLRPGKYVKISIKDRGVGIPSELLSKIFDPYFTTKKKESGLGLAIAYSIIKKHGGHITVESLINHGTTVYVYLPSSMKAIKERPTNESHLYTDKGRVLVMDDEDFIRKIASRMLNRFGYEVDTVENGMEAVEQFLAAKRSQKPYDAVILDLTIPGGMGGKETVQKLLEIDPKVKAIVSSGYSNDPIMAGFKKFGFKGVVMKPYKVEELRKALKKVL